MTPGGKLAVPGTISDAELATRLLPRRSATEYFVYGKDNCRQGDDMVGHAMKVAIPIFNAVYPGCQAESLLAMHPIIPLHNRRPSSRGYESPS